MARSSATAPATVACTAVTAAYAQAGYALAESWHRLRPGTPIFVMDLEGAAARWSFPHLEIVRPEDMIGEEAVHRVVALRGVDEALAWLRPLSILRALEAEGSVLWLDPTSHLLDPLKDVTDAANTARAHVTVVARAPVPLPDDGRQPPADGVGAAGIFSTSLLLATRRAEPFVRRWAEAERNHVRAVPWLDQIVAQVPHVVIEDSGLAVSPWSLEPTPAETRTTTGDVAVRGRPIRHMDLADFDPRRPWLLDPTASEPRVLLSERPALAALISAHAAQVRAAPPPPPARFSALPGGSPYSEHVRLAYRRAQNCAGEASPPDPFDTHSPGAFLAWLLEPVPGTVPPLSRYLSAVHDARADLRQAFPDVPGNDVAAFLAWAERHGRHELDTALLEGSLAAVRAAATSTTRRQRHRPPGLGVLGDRAPHGVNVVGYLRGELGIGESARLVLTALESAGVPHAATNVSRHLASREQAAFTGRGPAPHPYDTTLLCVNADHTADVAEQVPSLMRNRHRIGMWYWEVEVFPESLHTAFESVDEVWVATDFVREAVAPHSPVPVHTVPPPLPSPRHATTLTRRDLGLPDGFLFLFSFDYLSTAERKNPVGLIEAFRRAFPRGSGPTLVIKSINAAARIADAERLRVVAADEPDVLLLEDYLDSEARDALNLLTDCYVSLHRAEGLGLTMAEAMALGKPVIASAYGGNLQFMTPDNSWLVPCARTPIPEGCEPYPPGTPWADPDLDAAAVAMRAVVGDPEAAAARGARAAADLAAAHSPAVAGERIARQLAASRRARPALRRAKAWVRRRGGPLAR